MRIDGHAHASGELWQWSGIQNYLQKNHLNYIVLCPGERGNSKSRGLPMVADVFQSDKVGFLFNKLIGLATKLTGAAKHLEKQNRELGELCKKHPDQLLQAYWVNPTDVNCVKKMANQYERHPFCMVKTHQCWHKFDVLSPEIQQILTWVQKKNLPFFIHIKNREQGLKVAKLANKFPQVNFIVAHLMTYEEISTHKRFDNVYFDISAPFMIPFSTLQKAFLQMGSKRLLLGSDTPFGKTNILQNEKRLRRLELNREQMKQICGTNAYRLLVKKL